jgi:Cu-Zn family superoxide dismutase
LRVVVELFDAPPGLHGVHVHDFAGCAELERGVGHHFNPSRRPHGAPLARDSHAGDLGNLEVGSNGIGRLELVTPWLGLDGELSVVGFTVAVTARADDGASQPDGGGGTAIACGEIRLD